MSNALRKHVTTVADHDREWIIHQIAYAIEAKPSYVRDEMTALVDDLENDRDVREAVVHHMPDAEVEEAIALLTGEVVR